MRTGLILILLIGLQVVDVALHIAAGHVEPLRVAASAVLVLGAVVAWQVAASQRTAVALGALVYLALNTWFLVQNGITNPDSGALRVPLFGFVALSLALLYWLHLKLSSARS